MLLCYTLECGHAYNYRRHVKLTKDRRRWCRKCRELKKVTHIGQTPPLSKFVSSVYQAAKEKVNKTQC